MAGLGFVSLGNLEEAIWKGGLAREIVVTRLGRVNT